MKTVLLLCPLLCLIAAPGRAQDRPRDGANPSAACGKDGVSYKVRYDNDLHSVADARPDAAEVVFIHDAGTAFAHPLAYPTTKVAIDGAWVGANRGNSYFAVEITPGEHHVCSVLQTSLLSARTELAHFTAEPGKTYFYRTRLVMSRDVELLELEPIDSDQGRYLVASFPASVAKAKN